MTKLVDAVLQDSASWAEPAMALPDDKPAKLRKRLTQQQRMDLAVLAGLYDQPSSGVMLPRWRRLRKALRLGWRLPVVFWRNAAIVMTVVALGLGGWWYFVDQDAGSNSPWWLMPAAGLAGAAALMLWIFSLYLYGKTWGLSRKVAREMPAIGRTAATLRSILGELGADDPRRPAPADPRPRRARAA